MAPKALATPALSGTIYFVPKALATWVKDMGQGADTNQGSGGFKIKL